MGNLAYQDDEVLNWRKETHDGKIFMMAPPATNHNVVSGNIFRMLANYLKGKRCIAFGDNISVKLSEKNQFVPDVAVVCNRDIIKSHFIDGAPDLVVEVLSPSTSKNDRGHKKNIYEQYDVREYWLVNVESRTIEVYLLKEGKFELDEVYAVVSDDALEVMTDDEKSKIKYEFTPSMFPELVINIEDVFSGMFKF